MVPVCIDVLAYPGCVGMEVFGLCDTLLLANRVVASMGGAAAPLFEVRVVSLAGGMVVAAGGLSIGSGSYSAGPAMLVIPGMDISDRDGCSRPHPQLAAEVAAIAAAHAAGTPVAALCVGAFLLGEAGLLDGRRATTSWMFSADLVRRFPLAQVDAAAMLIEDGLVTTTGAFSATFDLAMHLIARHATPQQARAVARMALLNQRASQAAYIDTRMAARPSGAFSGKVQAWLRDHLAEPYVLATLAEAFHVSGRTLLRKLKEETGQSPLDYLQDERVNLAKRLLEEGELGLAQITGRVGYADVATFSTLFKRLAGQSPAQYRRAFKV